MKVRMQSDAPCPRRKLHSIQWHLFLIEAAQDSIVNVLVPVRDTIYIKILSYNYLNKVVNLNG